MKPLHPATALGLAVLLSACSDDADTVATGTMAENGGQMNAMADNMATNGHDSDMAMPAGGMIKMAQGTGTITAIDMPGGTITLAHEAISEANWPAMTMAFTANSDLLKDVAVGDRVAFDLALKGGAGEITALSKQ